MREFLESDTGVYVAVGLVTIAVFLVALVALAVVSPAGIGTTELGGFVVGFFLFISGRGGYPEVVRKSEISVITRIFDSRTT